MNTKYNFDEYLVNEARTIFWKVTLYSFSYMEVTDENGRTYVITNNKQLEKLVFDNSLAF